MFKGVIRYIMAAQTVVVAGHENPDGDCMGSCLALASMLRRMGKDVSIFKEDPFPYNYLFLEGSDDSISILPEKDPDLFIILDSGSPERVGETLYKRLQNTKTPKLLIDHHVQSDEKKAFYDEAIVESDACATGALIFELSRDLDLELNKAESEAIYAAIMSDTGGLRYGSTNKNAFLILSELLDKVKPWEIATNIYENVPVEQLKLLAEVLADMRILSDGLAAVIKVTREQLKRYSLKPDNVDSFVNFARSVKGAEIAMRFREKGDNLWKVSMRSRGDIDSSQISAEFGGGGHRNAAGFVFKGTFEEGLQKIREIVNRVAK